MLAAPLLTYIDVKVRLHYVCVIGACVYSLYVRVCMCLSSRSVLPSLGGPVAACLPACPPLPPSLPPSLRSLHILLPACPPTRRISVL